jgi:hypothetical protein
VHQRERGRWASSAGGAGGAAARRRWRGDAGEVGGASGTGAGGVRWAAGSGLSRRRAARAGRGL